MSEGIPEGWEENTLETLVSVDNDSLKGDTEPDYRFKYIDISCVSTGKVTPPTEKITFKDAPSRAKRVVKRGDVLVATVRPNLKAFAHFDEEGDNSWVASTGFAVLRHKENSDSRFIYNIMLSDAVSRQIDRLIAGSNYPAINSSDVKELTLLTPPLPEQKKIAAILTSVDEVIESTQQQINKLQDLKKATMNELLTQGIGHTEFKDSELGRIPKSWRVVQVNDAFELGRGRVISKEEIRANTGNYPVFSSQSYNKGKMGSINTYDFEGEYITWTTDGAYAGTVFYRNGKFNCTNVCGTVRDRNSYQVDMKFISEYLFTVAQNHVSYVGNPKLMNGVFGEIEIPIPPLPEQKKIAAILTSVDEVIEKKQNKLTHNTSLKKSLMQDLLTGKVRVTVN